MIRRTMGALLSSVALNLMLACPCVAQVTVAHMMTANFFVPETLDPNGKLTFKTMSPLTTGADDLLQPPGYPNVKALEIHSAVAGPRGGILDIDKFQVTFNFDGQIVPNSMTNPPYVFPWTVTDSVVGLQHTLNFVRAFPMATIDQIAPINDNFDPAGDPFHQSFGSLTFNPLDSASAQSFLNDNPGASIVVTPLATGVERVPEPGALAFLVGTGAVGGAWMLRRRAYCSI